MPDRRELVRCRPARWPLYYLFNRDVPEGFISVERAVGVDAATGLERMERGFKLHFWWFWLYLGKPHWSEFLLPGSLSINLTLRWGRHRLIDAAKLREQERVRMNSPVWKVDNPTLRIGASTGDWLTLAGADNPD